MSGWKTMDTAPKAFGTWIEAWREPAEFGVKQPLVYVTWKQFEDGDSAWVWPDDIYEVFTEAGRREAEQSIDRGDHYEEQNFTHWRDLSEPPAT